MRRIIAALAAATALGACTSIDCPVENNVATTYRLLKADGTQDILADTLTVTTRIADGTDSIVLNKSVDTQSFQLPVSYTNAADTFVFIRTSDRYVAFDTVCVEKTNLPQFESVDCKLVYFHDILSVKHSRNAIDSISINKARIDYDSNTDHIRIYFKDGL